MAFLDFKGPVQGCNVYINGALVGKDADVTLPELTFLVDTVRAMGNLDIPNYAMLETMEATISKKGADREMVKLATPGTQIVEVRFVLQSMDANGFTLTTPYKAYLTCMAKGVPSLAVVPGDPINVDITYTVIRYQLFINGEESILADKFKDQLVVDGIDFRAEVNKAL